LPGDFLKNSGFPHLDYGARYYHPLSSCWTTMDPMAEKYYSVSPYAFCSGNPVNFAIEREQNELAHLPGVSKEKPCRGLTLWMWMICAGWTKTASLHGLAVIGHNMLQICIKKLETHC